MATVQITCPHCATAGEVPEKYLRRRMHCAQCGAHFIPIEHLSPVPPSAVATTTVAETLEPPVALASPVEAPAEMLDVVCTYCGKTGQVPIELKGIPLNCSSCGNLMRVIADESEERVPESDADVLTANVTVSTSGDTITFNSELDERAANNPRIASIAAAPRNREREVTRRLTLPPMFIHGAKTVLFVLLLVATCAGVALYLRSHWPEHAAGDNTPAAASTGFNLTDLNADDVGWESGDILKVLGAVGLQSTGVAESTATYLCGKKFKGWLFVQYADKSRQKVKKITLHTFARFLGKYKQVTDNRDAVHTVATDLLQKMNPGSMYRAQLAQFISDKLAALSRQSDDAYSMAAIGKNDIVFTYRFVTPGKTETIDIIIAPTGYFHRVIEPVYTAYGMKQVP